MSEAKDTSRTDENTSSDYEGEGDKKLLTKKKRLNLSKKNRQKGRNEKLDFKHNINEEINSSSKRYPARETNHVDVIDTEQSISSANEVNEHDTDVNLTDTRVLEESDIGCGCFGKMFQHIKSKLFRSRASSPERKRAKLNDEKTESNVTSSTSQLSNQNEKESADDNANSSDIFAQELIHPEPQPRSISHDHSSSQLVENEENNSSNQDDEFQPIQKAQKRKRKRNNRRRKKSPVGLESSLPMPEEIRNDPSMKKYWKNRYRLFSKYDEGIKLDAAMWYSVTPEKISIDIARRCQCDVIVDAFCGAGGNAIQFAFVCERVIAIDIDAERINLAKHNAGIYGVADRIEFIVGDFFEVAPFLKADVVFLSPPWGGPSYINYQEYSLSQIFEPYGGRHVFNTAKQISDHIAYFLPKNICIPEIASLLKPDEYMKVDRNYLDNALIGITIYFGDLVEDYGDDWNN